MSADNVTPIGGKSPPPRAVVLPPGFENAINEQQTRVWRLRSLLDMLFTAVMDGRSLEDEEAAVQALIEYADGIHLALDVDSLKDRAAELAKEAAARGGQS